MRWLGRAAIAASLLHLLPVDIQGQEQTLVGDGLDHGGYGGPVWKVSSVAGDAAIFTGGRGGWIIDHRFVVGGGGYGLATDVRVDDGAATEARYLEMGYGGFEFEYVHRSDELVHLAVHTLIGAGSVELVERRPGHSLGTDEFFAFEPSVAGDLNVTNWFRIGGGVGYRLTVGADVGEVHDSDLSGVSGHLILKFGSF
jgi:hypothetical protein